jgi:DNA-directed RNA polymerase specialized sigma subunit
MTEKSLKDLITAAQKGDKEAAAEIVRRFLPVLKKYSRRLNGEETFSDLVLWLMTAIHQYEPEAAPEESRGGVSAEKKDDGGY